MAPGAQQRLLNRVLRRKRIAEDSLRLAQASCPRAPPVPSDRMFLDFDSPLPIGAAPGIAASMATGADGPNGTSSIGETNFQR